MGRARLWVVVEGRSFDIPFYEGLLTDGAGINEVEFIKAEHISVGGVAAGGKPHSLKIFRHLESDGSLEQENRATKVDVVFFVDRDDDEYVSAMVPNKHVQYTRHADVESEIINNTDLPAAVARTFSVSRANAQRHSPDLPAQDLALRWAEWVALRLAAKERSWGGARFAQSSGINVPKYGPVDQEKVAMICRNVENECQNWEESVERARHYVSEVSNAGGSAKLVKGKWLPPFIIHCVASSFGPEHALPRVDPAQLLTGCLMAVDFRRVWADSYAKNFVGILNR